MPSDTPDSPDPRAVELIRSEERLAVSTVRVPARRVRLEKFVVTETRTITVQVAREVVRLVDVDSTDPHAAPGGSGDDRDFSDLGDSGRWLTLSEERVTVTTEVVPVERVRLSVYSVMEQHAITDTIRREQVQLEPLPPASGPDISPPTHERDTP